MFVYVVPTAEDAGISPELNASNAHIPLQFAGLARREAGIAAGMAKRNRLQLDDGSLNPAYQPEGDIVKAIANARLASIEQDVHLIPAMAVDLRQTDPATHAAFLKLVEEAAIKSAPADGDTNGMAKGKAIVRLALSKVPEVITA